MRSFDNNLYDYTFVRGSIALLKDAPKSVISAVNSYLSPIHSRILLYFSDLSYDLKKAWEVLDA